VRLFDGRDLALDLTGDGRLQELRKGVRAQLRFSEATIPDLTAYNRYLGSPGALLRGTGTSAVMPPSIPTGASAMARPGCWGATPVPRWQGWTWAAMST
jgi:hypothetical protein